MSKLTWSKQAWANQRLPIIQVASILRLDYVALSYVWGKRLVGQEPYITKRENVMRHIQHGGLEKEWDKLLEPCRTASCLSAGSESATSG